MLAPISVRASKRGFGLGCMGWALARTGLCESEAETDLGMESEDPCLPCVCRYIHIYIYIHPRAESFDPRHMLDGTQTAKAPAE